MDIAIALFDQVTALDAVGPYEVLQRLPDAELKFVGHQKGEVRTDNGFLGLTVDYTFDELLNPEILHGLEATTHFSARQILSKYGAKPVEDRVVHQGKIITAAGVSALRN